MQNKKIGLLGGSFNPPHQGHVYISEQAINLAGLDEIWWLVAKQNPLKERQDTLPFAMRFAKSRDITSHNSQIYISDFEEQNNLTYSYDTLIALKEKYPAHSFLWIMGADNLAGFPKWHKWREIISEIPILVFNRKNYTEPALSGEVAIEFSKQRLKNPLELVTAKAPSWGFIDIETPNISSTEIRKTT